MSDIFDQVPFGEIVKYDPAIFAENPEPRCPCILVLDTSGSMSGKPINELNSGLKAFQEELCTDSLAMKRVEVAIVTFGPVRTVTDFQTVDQFEAPTLITTGDTPMGAALVHSLRMVESRKEAYRQSGIEYYRPWIFLITDGSPTDNWAVAAQKVREGEDRKQFQLFTVGVEGANFDVLRQISVREPLKLRGLMFRELFSWLSNSLGAVSHSQTFEQVPLSNPVTPGGWATAG